MQVKPARPRDTGDTWAEVFSLIQAGDYESALAILTARREHDERTDSFTVILDEARRLCQACGRYREEGDRYDLARLRARDAELEVLQKLSQLLRRIGSGINETQVGLNRSSVPAPVEEQAPTSSSSFSKRATLLDRLLSWLSLFQAVGGGLKRTKRRDEEARLTGAYLHPDIQPSDGDVESEFPLLTVRCLGSFEVRRNGQLINDWPNGKAKVIFKYLLVFHERPVPKEVLMELLWPGSNSERARNCLNVAIYHLRQYLLIGGPDFHYVIFTDNCYQLNPQLRLRLDYEEFSDCVERGRSFERAGKETAAIQQYEAARRQYRGAFLEEDRYEDWPISFRRRFTDEYLFVLERLSDYSFSRHDYHSCATACQTMLAVDPCCEAAHRRLMQCYSRQGQRHQALRQYRACATILAEELDVQPCELTKAIFDQIRRVGPV